MVTLDESGKAFTFPTHKDNTFRVSLGNTQCASFGRRGSKASSGYSWDVNDCSMCKDSWIDADDAHGRLRMGSRNEVETVGITNCWDALSGVACAEYYTTERTGWLCVGRIGQDEQPNL